MFVTVSEPDGLRVLGVLILGVLVVYEVVYVVRHLMCPPAHCRCPVPHKFLAGLPLHGHVVTDATYWRAAAKDLTQAKTVGPWLKMPGWKRRAWRTAPLLAAGGALISPVLAGTVACAVLVYVAAAWAARRTGWRGSLLKGAASRVAARLPGRLVRMLRFRHRGRVQTMGMLLASITGTASSSVEAGVTWNPDYTTAKPGDEVARWVLPRGFKATGGEKSSAAEVWQSRIGFGLTFSWQLDVDEPVLVMKRAFQLPALVYLHEVLEKVRALPEHKTAIGVDDRGNLICWDWKTENPHGLLNAGSRHGKTETELAMVAQVLEKGGRVTYVDVKRVSIHGLAGVPRLTLADDPRDMVGMWLTIDKWGQKLDQRIDDRTKDPTCEFDRDLLVLEEVNQFSEMCDEFWENWPEEDEEWKDTILWKPKRAKKTPPIWRVVKKGVWEGAFAKMNVLIAGQNIEAQTVKGIRNSIGMRLMGGYQPQNWKALVGTTPIPAAPPTKGRWCMINGSSQTWVQALIADLDANESARIWRDYARAGRRMDGTAPVTSFAVTGAGEITAAGQSDATDRTHGYNSGSATADPRGVLVGLAEAVEREFAPGATVQALRMDRHRSDKGELPDGLRFPEPGGNDGAQKELFWSAELIEFNKARRGRKVA
jgi:hypothetical protein